MIGKNAARSLLAWLRENVSDRRRSPRRGTRFAASVPASVSLLEAGGGHAPEALRSPSVSGETRDLGPSGLTVRVERVRVGGQYLTDGELHLGVRLELPAGEVSLLAKVVRFEHTPEAGGGAEYLLGLRILKMTEDDFTRYSGFLRTLMPLERRRRERESGRQRVLELATPGAEIISREEPLTSQEISRAFEKFLGGAGPGGRP